MHCIGQTTIDVVFVQLIASMTGPTGRWNDIPSRLRRHFGTVHCAVPDDQLLDQIFTVTATSYFSDEHDFSREIQQLVFRLVPLTRRLWHATKVSPAYLLTYCYYCYSCVPIKVGSVNKSF